ncbi:MAG: preprotein translocase subunit SecE [Candidatus Doudnabacteria bacterium]|nr:preprotein translocase subunit SecE [Candidatus Doudnabacteria bacterium]
MTKFLIEVKNEMMKVVWPTKLQTLQYTFVVIGFSLVVSLILAAFDFGLFKLFEKIV